MALTALALENLSGVAWTGRDFTGQNLRGRKLNHSKFIACNFDKADLTEANCEWCDFTGSTFRDTMCTRTNFKDARLVGTVFEPKDCYGMTITLQCQTFQGMKISQLHWYSWLILASMMTPASGPVKGDLTDRLINAIGAERYVKMKNLFRNREI